MKKVLFSLSFFLALTTSSLGQGFGVGVSLGAPSGFSGNYFLSDSESIDGFFGFDLGDDIDLHSDYLWHKKDVFNVEGAPLNLYYGIGARFLDEDGEDDFYLGVRAPVAIYYRPDGGFFEAVLEFAGIYSFIEESKSDIEGAILIRVYF